MNEGEQYVAKLLVRHPLWKWETCMGWYSGDNMQGVGGTVDSMAAGKPLTVLSQELGFQPLPPNAVPDLDNPATLGFLLRSLMSGKSHSMNIYHNVEHGSWRVSAVGPSSTGSTLGEVLAVAWIATRDLEVCRK